MRLVIVGAGAVGGALAVRLHAAGREVVVVQRGAHGDAIRAGALVLRAPDGEVTARLACVARLAELDARDGDVVLIAVKTQDVAAVVDDVVAWRAGRSPVPVACLTNGLEAERVCARRLADVHGVCVMTPCEHLEPGVVRQWMAPVRGILDVGRYPRGTERVDAALRDAFRAAGYRSDAPVDVMRWKRTKLLLNVGNIVEALCGVAARDSELVRAARAEAIAVFDAAGLSYASDAEDTARRIGLASGPIGDTTRKGGSTWQSLARGLPLETDYLTGEIVLLGRLHAVATPVNERLQRAAWRAAVARLAPGSLAIDELSRPIRS